MVGLRPVATPYFALASPMTPELLLFNGLCPSLKSVTAVRHDDYAEEDLDIFSWELSDTEMDELSAI